MKNKKIVILLLVLAAGIWGTVIYRIFNTIHREDIVQIKSSESNPGFSPLPDTFSIVADYRDPFLGRRLVAQLPKKITPGETKSKPAPVVTVIKWPSVSYSGTIRNQNSKDLALVKIDQKDFIMKVGDVTHGIELSKIFKDSIIVVYQKEKRIITK